MNNPNSIPKSPYPSDRRSASPSLGSIARSHRQIITKTAYDEVFRKEKDMDPKLRALCVGRVRLSHALFALDSALKSWNPQNTQNGLDNPVYNKLRGIRVKIERIVLEYPLEIR